MRCSEEIENKILLERKLTEFSFDNMVKHFRSLISDFPDKRTGSNTRYAIEDAWLGAFSVFLLRVHPFWHFKILCKKQKGKATLNLCSESAILIMEIVLILQANMGYLYDGYRD